MAPNGIIRPFASCLLVCSVLYLVLLEIISGWQIPWNWTYRWLEAMLLVLGQKPKPCIRAVNALKDLPISQDPEILFWWLRQRLPERISVPWQLLGAYDGQVLWQMYQITTLFQKWTRQRPSLLALWLDSYCAPIGMGKARAWPAHGLLELSKMPPAASDWENCPSVSAVPSRKGKCPGQSGSDKWGQRPDSWDTVLGTRALSSEYVWKSCHSFSMFSKLV